MKQCSDKKNKGFSLIEVLVSVALLGIILVPLLSHFVMSIRMNVKAKEVQTATIAAQAVMEEIKGEKFIRDIAIRYNDPDNSGYEEIGEKSAEQVGSSWVFKAKDIYNFQKTVQIDGKELIARITMDSTRYNTSIGGSRAKYNKLELPVAGDLSALKNVVAREAKDEVNIMATDFAVDNAGYLAAHTEIAEAPKTLAQIRAVMKRTIYLTISNVEDISGNPSTESMNVEVKEVYECPGITGCDTPKRQIIFSGEVKIADMQNIYIFFRSIRPSESIIEDIQVVIDQDNGLNGLIQKYNLYLICQKETDEIDSSYEYMPENQISISTTHITKLDNVYSNATGQVTLDGTVITAADKDRIVQTYEKQRLMDITVELYKPGEVGDSNKCLVKLVSTKGE